MDGPMHVRVRASAAGGKSAKRQCAYLPMALAGAHTVHYLCKELEFLAHKVFPLIVRSPPSAAAAVGRRSSLSRRRHLPETQCKIEWQIVSY